MRSQASMRAAQAVLCLAGVLGLCLAASPSQALPAYSNRLGVPCSTCHEPLFARLNKTGWLFRRLGYRMPSEIGQKLIPGQKTEGEEGTTRYNYADTLSVMARMRYDDLSRSGAQRFSQFYVNDIIGFFTGPVEKNLGYFLEAVMLEHAPTYNKAAKRYDIPESSFELEFAEMKYFSGKKDGFFSTKLGQFGFGGIDGYKANDRPVSTGRPMMFTQNINQFSQDVTQRGADFGYTAGDNHFTIAYLNGVDAEGHGDVARPINSPDWLFQYLRWLGKSGSAAQLLYYAGKTPLGEAAMTDSFHRFMALGNWRLPLGEQNAFELLGGYMNGSHHRATAVGGDPLNVSSIGGSFNVSSYFLVAQYAMGHRTVPYLRYDVMHSEEAPYGSSTFPGNPGRNTRQLLLGVGHMFGQNVRTNLEWAHTTRNPGAKQDLVRAQVWFMW